VGISIFAREGQPSLWENGISQNVLFLAQLLERVPEVESVFLINGGVASNEDVQRLALPYRYPVLSLNDAHAQLDLAIEMGAQFSIEWITSFRQRGASVVLVCVGNNYVIDIERMAHNLPPAFLVSGAPYDEVWTIPEYERTCKAYYEVALRAPVHIVPHLWAPDFLRAAERELPEGQRFQYQPRSRWRVGVFEPNICMVKTCHVPMLAIDQAFRLNPGAIEMVRVFNALELKEHAGFVAFATSLDIVKQHRATFEGRWPIATAMTEQADVIVSHHWENGQNYLYYEALYGGYPLVHNSPFLDGCGYHYGDFDSEAGGLALLRAHREHDATLPDYRSRATRYLAGLDPLNPANVAVYRDAMLRAMAHRSAGAAAS
jgi:hypothetical protein